MLEFCFLSRVWKELFSSGRYKDPSLAQKKHPINYHTHPVEINDTSDFVVISTASFTKHPGYPTPMKERSVSLCHCFIATQFVSLQHHRRQQMTTGLKCSKR